MKNGICPKCKSGSVYENPFHGGFTASAAVGAFTGFKLTQYICVNCGFVESYMADMADAKKVMEKCAKVAGTA